MPTSLAMLNGGQVAAGPLHIHNGTGGMLFVTKTGVDNVAQTIIPDGAGDVVRAITGFAVLYDGTGTTANTITLLPGDNLDVSLSTMTLRLALSAGGALTVVRQSGTGSATVSLLATWL